MKQTSSLIRLCLCVVVCLSIITPSLYAQVKLVSQNAKPVKTGGYMSGAFATLFKEKKLIIVYPKKAPVNGRSAANIIDVWDHKINRLSTKALDVTPDEKAVDFVEKGFTFNEKIYLLFSKFNKKEKSYTVGMISIDDKGEVEEPKDLINIECLNMKEMYPVTFHFSEDQSKLMVCIRQAKKNGKAIDWNQHFVILNTQDFSIDKKELYTYSTTPDAIMRSWNTISPEGKFVSLITETSTKTAKASQKISLIHKYADADSYVNVDVPSEGFNALSNVVMSFINNDSILISGFYSDKGIDDANGMIYYILNTYDNSFPVNEVIEFPGNAKKELKHYDPKKMKSKSTVIRIAQSEIVYVSDTAFLLAGVQSDDGTVAQEMSGKHNFHLDESSLTKKNAIFSLIGYDGTIHWSKIIPSNSSYLDTFNNEAMVVVVYNDENKMYRVGASGDLNLTKLGKPKPENQWSGSFITRTTPTQFTAIGYKAPKGFDPIFVNLVDLNIAMRKSKVEIPKKSKK